MIEKIGLLWLSGFSFILLNGNGWHMMDDWPVSRREIITEALLKYFRYKDQEVPDIKVGENDTRISDAKVFFDRDLEMIKLDSEIKILQSKIEAKDEIIENRNELIQDLKTDKRYFQTQMHIMRTHFMPLKIGWLKLLLPSGKKVVKAQEELNKLEKNFVTVDKKDYKVKEKIESKKSKKK